VPDRHQQLASDGYNCPLVSQMRFSLLKFGFPFGMVLDDLSITHLPSKVKFRYCI
jgi:hypothetical protein